MGAALEIVGTGSSTLRLGSRKGQPGCGIRPQHFAKGWPALVIEAGYSESRAKAVADASAWWTRSQGLVQICFVVTINRKLKDISVRKWCAEELTHGSTKAYLAQELKIAQGPNGSEPEITNSPLVVEFKRLLARDPNPEKRDVIVGNDRLGLMAMAIWESRNR